MPWKMVTSYGTNVTLQESVKEIKARKENRKLVSRFEAEHRDEIDEMLGLIDCIDKGCIEERFPDIYKFGPERLGYPINRSYNQLDHFKKTEILMRLNMLKRWRPS